MARPLFVAACMMALWNSLAPADVVFLKNGDRISGKIETLADAKLTMKSDALGSVVIDFTRVQTFSTDAPITLKFKDGTVVHQRIESSEAGRIAVQPGGLLPEQTFAVADLAALNPPEKPKPEWKGHATASATVTTGNSETTAGSLDASLVRRGEDDRISLRAHYLYAEQKDPVTDEDRATTDKWSVGAKYDYFVTPKLYAFANASYEKDRIANLDARAIGAVGMGYQWIESKGINFNTDLGLGAMHESYTDPDRTNNTLIGQAGWHFDASLTRMLAFLHDFRITPDLERMSNYKIRTNAELRAALTKALFASFKVLVDHDSRPAAGREKTDMAYILGVGVNF